MNTQWRNIVRNRFAIIAISMVLIGLGGWMASGDTVYPVGNNGVHYDPAVEPLGSIIDSKVDAAAMEQIGWAGNQHIVFVAGLKKNKEILGNKEGASGEVVVEWTINAAPKIIGKTDGGFIPCPSGRAYWIEKRNSDGTMSYFIGDLNNLQSGKVTLHKFYVDLQNCKFISEDLWKKNVIFLQNNEGYIYKTNDHSPDSKLRMYSSKTDSDQITDIPTSQLTGCFSYVPTRGAYMLASCGWDSPKITYDCLSIWWLWSDGRTQHDCAPFPPWGKNNSAVVQVLPTKVGYFIVPPPEDAIRGGYLIENNRYRRILDGIVDAPSLSPDACSIAFRAVRKMSDYGLDGNQKVTLRVLTLC